LPSIAGREYIFVAHGAYFTLSIGGVSYVVTPADFINRTSAIDMLMLLFPPGVYAEADINDEYVERVTEFMTQ